MKSKPKKLEIKSTTVMIGIVIALIVVNLLVLLFISSTTKTANLLRSEMQSLEQNERLTTSSQTTLNEYADEIDTISQVFPDETTFPVFIQIMENLLRSYTDEYALRFTSVTPIKEQDKLVILLSITLKTDQGRLQQYFGELEKLPYMTHITNIVGKTPTNFSDVGEITLTLKVYVQNPFNTQ